MKSLLAALTGLLIACSVGSAEENKAEENNAEAAPVAAQAKFALIEVEQNIIDHTNAQRRRHGLPELAVAPTLMISARNHAAWMTRSNSLVHTRAMVAENIAMGQTSSAEAVQSWMNSPGHRANMLGGSYRYVGAAAYRTPSGVNYWCIQFLR